jgi:hypothetical protein
MAQAKHASGSSEPAVEMPVVLDVAWRNHVERHTDYGDVVRDIIIGFADGLTVPFALTAGLSS